MNLSGREQVEVSTVNVVSLFGRSEVAVEENIMDPMAELLMEANIEDFDLQADDIKTPKLDRKVVSASQFPDQSMHVLDQQLASLRSNLNRIKFYLGDLEDLLPR